MQGIDYLKQFDIIDSEFFINKQLAEGKSVLCEGAQGTMLDIDFGSYPFVTSSNTICAGACAGLGVAPRMIGEVFGIFKAYCTRVGAGPFPTELVDETGAEIRRIGHDFPFSIEGDIKPIYTELPGWKSDMTHLTSEDQFPKAFSDYIDFLEQKLGVPITIVSVGPDRQQTILRAR